MLNYLSNQINNLWKSCTALFNDYASHGVQYMSILFLDHQHYNIANKNLHLWSFSQKCNCSNSINSHNYSSRRACFSPSLNNISLKWTIPSICSNHSSSLSIHLYTTTPLMERPTSQDGLSQDKLSLSTNTMWSLS